MIPRWPFVILRIYAGLILLGVAAQGGGWLAAVSGAALLLGAATPAAALIGLAIVLDHILPLKTFAALISPGPRIAFAVLLVTVAATRAGRMFGLDVLLTRRYPRIPVW